MSAQRPLSAKEVVEAARLNVIKNLLNEVRISRQGGNASENLVDIVTLDKINCVYECHTLNLSAVNKAYLNSMEAIGVFFNQFDDIVSMNNITVELRIRGKTLKSQPEIEEHR